MIDTQKIFDFDRSKLSENIRLIAGIDEVGRGPLAGPVVTACVIMPYDSMINGVYDSKKVSKKNRERLYNEIINSAISYSITMRDEREIDRVNILNATKDAMIESYYNLKIKPDLLMIDAVSLNVAEKESPIVKGDETSYAIACASILAKVYRDRLMENYATKYPEYDFEHNVGYGTKKHIEAIKAHGITDIHRLSFLKNIIGEDECRRRYMAREAK